MKERWIKLAKTYGGLVGFPLFYLLCLAVFASMTFPYDVLRDRIVATYNKDQSASGGLQELQIDSMDGHWLTGVHMHGVTLTTGSSEVGKAPTKMSIDDATVRYALLPALFGGSRIDFVIHAFGGAVNGALGASGEDRTIDATVDSMDVGSVGSLSAILGAPVDGKLEGLVRLKMPGGKLSKATGQVALDVKGMAVGDGKAKVMNALAMPRLDVGTLTLSGDAKDGNLKLTKLSAAGKDVDIAGDGRVQLRDQPSDSLLDLNLRFRINDTYRSKSEVTKTLFGPPGTTGQGVFELADPRIKQSRRADGFYAWTVHGPMSHPDFTPVVARPGQ
ncbi:MAG: type II secretion system protein GspN [Polyangiaceae bacterium]|nr:type II secretion system protein GspN [Polyangiaceae bacterium]